eukprot:TRINITY_DN50402_c0_g1_i1.p1 TRINITY_DN50402_c0_g1~~TRINITY_DN50402_c0_g1_i1.p1  ORF type:complete len:543 (+),score=90.03 TRINITY_DN50402_c0_g1_i1:251-1879(+)
MKVPDDDERQRNDPITLTPAMLSRVNSASVEGERSGSKSSDESETEEPGHRRGRRLLSKAPKCASNESNASTATMRMSEPEPEANVNGSMESIRSHVSGFRAEFHAAHANFLLSSRSLGRGAPVMPFMFMLRNSAQMREQMKSDPDCTDRLSFASHLSDDEDSSFAGNSEDFDRNTFDSAPGNYRETFDSAPGEGGETFDSGSCRETFEDLPGLNSGGSSQSSSQSGAVVGSDSNSAGNSAVSLRAVGSGGSGPGSGGNFFEPKPPAAGRPQGFSRKIHMAGSGSESGRESPPGCSSQSRAGSQSGDERRLSGEFAQARTGGEGGGEDCNPRGGGRSPSVPPAEAAQHAASQASQSAGVSTGRVSTPTREASPEAEPAAAAATSSTSPALASEPTSEKATASAGKTSSAAVASASTATGASGGQQPSAAPLAQARSSNACGSDSSVVSNPSPRIGDLAGESCKREGCKVEVAASGMACDGDSCKLELPVIMANTRSNSSSPTPLTAKSPNADDPSRRPKDALPKIGNAATGGAIGSSKFASC